jgi:hypothetical protein
MMKGSAAAVRRRLPRVAVGLSVRARAFGRSIGIVVGLMVVDSRVD